MTSTDTQEESMKLGGGTANGMRALGYQVLPPEPNSDSTCWRMIAPQDRNTEYLAADQAEGWRKAERHWHARNLENVVRLTPPTPATEEPWEGPLTDKENAMLEAAWQKHKDAAPPTPAAEDREAVALAMLNGKRVREGWPITTSIPEGFIDADEWRLEAQDALSALRETRAAEILAAEARGYADAEREIASWLYDGDTCECCGCMSIAASEVERGEHRKAGK